MVFLGTGTVRMEGLEEGSDRFPVSPSGFICEESHGWERTYGRLLYSSNQPRQAEVSRYPYNPHHETTEDFNDDEDMEPLTLQVDDDVDTMIDI
ncbi:unnamed protein product [Clonostachys chloroleuca]|uniref:Uncharacterized protein n=1 Tax=Clonostachys chloroleuca TaxID=1926264 RepID=A0AA35M8X8_9HYPO|nr:unnamed protein product [Clonostachys chloroleuca]